MEALKSLVGGGDPHQRGDEIQVLLEILLPDPRGSSLGVSLSAKKASKNLEKVPRIWEVEGPGGPR